MTVYDRLCLFIICETEYIQAYTMLSFYMNCLRTYITWYSCMYLYLKIFFQLHPAGWPGWNTRICSCHCFYTRHLSSSTMVFNFSRFYLQVPACRGRQQLQQGRPQRLWRQQRRSPCELAEPSSLRPWQLAAPASCSMIWTTTLSGRNQNLKVDACVESVDRLRLPSWGCPRSRREQGWCCLGRGCAMIAHWWWWRQGFPTGRHHIVFCGLIDSIRSSWTEMHQ